MINILHLRDTHEIGGPGKTILETVSHIDNSRFKLHIGVFKTRREKEDSPFVTEGRRRGFSVHSIDSFNQFDPRIVLGVIRLVNELGIDLIHTHETKSDIIGLMAARCSGRPVITTVHGWIFNTLKQRIYIGMDKKSLRYFDRVIAVSEKMRNELLACSVPRERIDLLHNGIVVENYKNSGKRGFLNTLAQCAKNRPVIGTVGRLSREKGHRDLVIAVSLILKQGLDISCFIIGDGPEREHLEKLISDLSLQNNVFLTGYLREPQRAIEDLDLFVLPSYTEGLPNVVLESLLMDVPVIATRVGGTPDVIENGTHGVLVEPGSPADLAAAITDFSGDPKKYRLMAQAGKNQVITRFNFTNRTRQLENIYEDVIQAARSKNSASDYRKSSY